MARLPIISKYCVVRVGGAVAFFASNVYVMLTPSIGLCLITAPGRPLRAADLPVPEPGPGQLLARVRACGV
jgi:hypothetical protein